MKITLYVVFSLVFLFLCTAMSYAYLPKSYGITHGWSVAPGAGAAATPPVGNGAMNFTNTNPGNPLLVVVVGF